MNSTKNSSPRSCIKCAIMLSDENWASYDKKVSHYICKPCRKIQDKRTHSKDSLYNDKQLARTRERKSAVIFAYGNKCELCMEDDYDKLTIDHINNNGGKHRKEVGNVYEWLFNQPVMKDGYQVLCYNCSKNVEYKDKYALRDKIKVIDNYGGICLECNEDRIERLTIDHKENDGAEQRRQLKCHTGSRMYRWIIKNDYPSDLGLQILCFNCNCSKLSKNKRELKLDGV